MKNVQITLLVLVSALLSACAPLTPTEQQVRAEYYARKDHSAVKADFKQVQKTFNEANDNSLTGM